MDRFTLFDIAGWLKIPAKKNGLIRSFQYDSRSVGPGDLFFALKGKRRMGTPMKDLEAEILHKRAKRPTARRLLINMLDKELC